MSSEAPTLLDGRPARPTDCREVSPYEVIETILDTLDGDGSTGTMPDVTTGQAAVWIARKFDELGWRIVKPITSEGTLSEGGAS